MTENQKIIQQLLKRLDREFEGIAPAIALVIAEEVGRIRLCFPDVNDLQRYQRNVMICREFRRHNAEELALRYKLSTKQIVNIAGESW